MTSVKGTVALGAKGDKKRRYLVTFENSSTAHDIAATSSSQAGPNDPEAFKVHEGLAPSLTLLLIGWLVGLFVCLLGSPD